MKDYTPEEVKHIAAEECPHCGIPMSYNDSLKGFTCNGCRLLIPYATYKACKNKDKERIAAYIEDWKETRANKR